MDNIITIANEGITHKQSDIEIELRAGHISTTHYHPIIKSCSEIGTPIQHATDGEYDMSFSIICSNLMADTSARDRSIAIRRGIEKGSPVYGLEKERIAFLALDGARFVVSRETTIVGALPKPRGDDVVRFRARRSWSIDVNGVPWIIDVTIVRERTYAQFVAGAQGKGENKVIQGFRGMVTSGAFDQNDFIEFEIELDMRAFIVSDRARDLARDDLARVIEIAHRVLDVVPRARDDTRTRAPLRKRILLALAHILDHRPRDSSRLSLKTLLNNARSMDVMQYARTIFPNIGGYYVTGKADGMRGIMVIDSTDKCAILTDSDVLGNDGCMTLGARLQHVLDGEVMESSGVPKFLAFDCLVIDGRACIDRIFSERIGLIDGDLIEKAHTLCEPFASVEAKKYERIDSTGADIKDVVQRVAASGSYKTDGIIFTQPDAAYGATINFKWKPADNMTIDFLCVKCPRSLYGRGRYQLPVDGMTYAASSAGRSEYVIYLLFCDCTEDQLLGLCIHRLDEWREIAETIPTEQRARIIHFSSNFDPLAYILVIREQEVTDWLRAQGADMDANPSLHGRVVEMRPCARDCGSRKWDLVRLRTDRVTGNNIAVANSVYASSIAPFTMEMLWEPARGYFDTDESRKDLIPGNKYRRFVIGAVMSSVLVLEDRAHDRILDIGGGRAQDFVRYAAIGAKFVVNYDSDKYAIVEGVSRVTSLVRNNGIARANAASHIRALVLDSKQCTRAIARAIAGGATSLDPAVNVKCYAPTYIGRVADMNSMTVGMFKDDLRRIWCDEHSFDVAFSSFAFHYFCGSRATIKSVWSIIDLALSAQGVVIITTMDGDEVTKLLTKSEGHWGSVETGTKYEIARIDGTRRIRVSVPFSRELLEEPLCFVEELDNVAGEFGFARIYTIEFGARSMLDLFGSYEPELRGQMNEEDITYTSLFRTYIYGRNAKRTRAKKK